MKLGKQNLFRDRSFAYTPQLLSCEGHGAFWEYYQDTNHICVYGHAFIKDIYGFDVPYIEYELAVYNETFCPEDLTPTMADELKRAVVNRFGYDHIHPILNQRLGTYRMIHALGIIRDTGQKLILCGCLQDIRESTGFERWDTVSAEVKKQIRSILNITPTACMFWNDRYQIVNCNNQAIELFQCSSKEALYQRFPSFSPEYQPDGSKSSEKQIAYLRKAMESGMEVYDWWYRLHTGEDLPVEITLLRVFWDGAYCIASHIRDLRQFKQYLTTIEQTQEKLIAARNRAEESDRAKSEFLANMSHELRTPMNGILGMTKLLLQSEITEKQRLYTTTIDQSAKQLLRIINDILDFSLINEGKLPFEQVPFSLQQILGEVIDSVLPDLRNLTISFAQEPGIPDTLIGDPLRLTQILVNILDNGIKFTTQGGISLKVFMDKPPESVQVKLGFSISDTGIGMSEEQIAKVFIPFAQVDSSLTRRYGGTGLGLTICKNLVTLMGGSIACESAVGKGTTVTFTGCFGKASPEELPVYHRVAGKRVFALMDDKQDYAVLSVQCQILGCNLLGYSTDKDTWEQTLPLALDVLLISWAELRPHIQETLERWKALLQYSGTSRPGLLIFVKDPEEEAFITASDVSCQVLYKPVRIASLYSHIDALLSVRSEQEETPPVTGTDPIPMIPDQIRGAYVLLVEDNEINQIMASELLTLEGFKVDIASNGQEAVEMVAQHDYDIVLMDIQMPEMDGLTATRIIRQSANTIPILALTAHTLALDREKSLEAGMNDHITKPLDHTLLFNAMARWVRPHPQPQQLHG
ncbi:MAG: response regulator [Treponema sp.]|jgi:signal transduction histidine kinase/ActR/RegA family two-component response regulator|nr:response regulator [Treponema sp.]